MHARLLYSIIGFAASVLPEPARKTPPLDRYDSPGIHFLSGLLEIAAGLALLTRWYFSHLHRFSGVLDSAVRARPDSTRFSEGDFHMLAVAAFAGFLLHPVSWLWAGMALEGFLRSLAAFLTEGRPGTLAGSLIYALVRALRGRISSSARRERAGSFRRDHIVPPDRSVTRRLEIYSPARKPWADRQIVCLAEEFFILEECRCIHRRHWDTWLYLFRPLGKGEIIRGTPVRLPAPAVPTPRSPSG